MKHSIFKIALAFLAFVNFVQISFSQTQHTQFANNLNTAAKSLVNPVVNISTLVIGFAAFVTLAYSIFSYFKGDQQSKDLFIKVGGGAISVLVLMYAIRSVFLA